MEWFAMAMAGSLAVVLGWLTAVLAPAIADRIRYGRKDRDK